MKKLIFSAVILAVIASAVLVVKAAPNQKATLVNPDDGSKVVVAVGSPAAQYYFGQGYTLLGAKPKECTKCLGANSGPEVYQRMYFNSGFNDGGTVRSTTTTASTYTLTAKDFDEDTSFLWWTPNVSTTITTMASSSGAATKLGIPKSGNTRVMWLYNASTTVASTITIAAGAGIDLQKNEDTANLATAGTSMTKMTFIRRPDTDIMLILEQYDVAD